RLEELGILTYATPDGWRYPLSESAVTVAQALAAALELAGVEPYLQTQVTDLGRSEGQLHLVLGDPRQPVAVDRAVVATGGKAYPALGSRGAFFPVLGRLGHTIAPIFPALVPIMADIRPVHKLQGVRLDAGLKLYEGERLLGETFGNLLFTDVGLSGPAAMNLSHAVSTRPGAALTLSIDLLHAHRPALLALIARQRTQAVPMEVILGAVLPAKVPPVALELAGLGLDARLNVLNEGALARLLALLGDLRLRATGTRGFQHAQLSTGGVPVTEVAPETMASRIVPGLHLAGEVLDVVGPCGGYNLQFALTSGALAGQAAAC
ncbi:MAG: aminoacetone oxidase family FAD-binding enzyme, partial [Chloroflexota bacterium]